MDDPEQAKAFQDSYNQYMEEKQARQQLPHYEHYDSPTIPSHGPGGLDEPGLESWFLYWDKVASPFFNSVPAYDLYNATSKGGWRATRYAFNTSFIEAGVAGFRQYYQNSQNPSLSTNVKMGRAVLIGGEAGLIDYLAGIAGGVFGAAGAGVGGPIGAGLGYIGGNVLTTRVGEHLANDFNQNWASKVFGDFP